MKNGPLTIGHYRSVLAGARRMHEHARRQQWDQVAMTAREVTALTDAMRGSDPALLPDAGDRRERLEILTQIVRIDGEIRHLRDPATARLDALLTPGAARG